MKHKEVEIEENGKRNEGREEEGGNNGRVSEEEERGYKKGNK